MKRIYLAGPYTDNESITRRLRFLSLTAEASNLMNQGHVVFSPITHGYPIEKHCNIPGDWEFWRRQCFSFIENWAEEVHVLMLPGWAKSVGVKAEIELAEKLGLAVKYIECIGSDVVIKDKIVDNIMADINDGSYTEKRKDEGTY